MQKFILTITFALIVFNVDFCFSQGTSRGFNKKEISGIEGSFNWDIQVTYRGRLMFLDVPYRSGDSLQYVTLTVAKDYKYNRPVFISVIVPPLTNPNNGISLRFAKTMADSGKWKIAIDKNTYTKLPIERCNKKFCTARMYNGIARETGYSDTADVFKEFMYFNQLIVSFTDEGGPEEVMIPLFSFQKEYNQLVAMDEKPPLKIPYDSIQLTPEEEKGDSNRSLWMYSEIRDPTKFKKFLKYLKYLVKNNKKEEISQLIEYPLKVNITISLKDSTYKLNNGADFLNNYDTTFNNEIKTAIENEKLTGVFGNIRGTYISRGRLWFMELSDGEFKITSINQIDEAFKGIPGPNDINNPPKTN